MTITNKMTFLVAIFLLLSKNLLVSSETNWAKNTLQSMSIEEKIGQLFMVGGYVDPEFAKKEIGNSEIIQEMDQYISQYYIGGIAYVGPSESSKQVNLSNHYQAISKYPILIAQDLEWGLYMRLTDGMRFPKNITLEKVDDELIYQLGKEIGHQAKLIGVHMNLSPVLDVNIEPENIVINVRSFGESPSNVSKKGIAMIKGLQDSGIIASAKHFPGLGDITNDPHLSLPTNLHNRSRLNDVELYPFAQAIAAGVLSIQTEHVLMPALDPAPKGLSSLSPKIINDLLKNELGFNGLVLSGALRMKALTSHFSDEEIVLKAFQAGNDMLLMPNDLPKAYQVIKSALNEGTIAEKEIDERVLKILKLKEKVKLNCQRSVPIPTEKQLHSPQAKILKKKLFSSAVTYLRKNKNLIPFSPKTNIAYVQCGEAPSNEFSEKLKDYFHIDSFLFSSEQNDTSEKERLLSTIDNYPIVVLAIYPLDPRRIVQIRLMNEQKQKEELKDFRVHGVTESMAQLIHSLDKYQEKIRVVHFGNPFGLHFLNSFSNVVMAYETDVDAQEAAAELIISN